VSDAGDILTALTTDVEAAVTGVTVTLDNVNMATVKGGDLPYCRLLLVDYTVEVVEWGQERRVWAIAGELKTEPSTREAMQLLLDAIRDAVFSDSTLDAAVDVATCAPLVPYTAPDEPCVFGGFTVLAEKVV
jgi:hypothetical protein